MILVTGANGHLGRAIVEHLSQRTAPAQIIAASREPDSLSPPDGVAVRRADFADPASLPEAFAGIERIEIVSVDKLGEEARSLHRNAIAAANDAGVERIFYTSHAGAREGSPGSNVPPRPCSYRSLMAVSSNSWRTRLTISS